MSDEKNITSEQHRQVQPSSRAEKSNYKICEKLVTVVDIQPDIYLYPILKRIKLRIQLSLRIDKEYLYNV